MSRRSILVFALVMALLPLTARRASASPNCSESYLTCINDAFWIGTGAELECGVEWVGCIGAKLVFW